MVAALLAEAPKPVADDHPALHRAYKRATSHVVTLWRLAYDIPINDPRTQQISDYDAAIDLLERAYYRNRWRRDRPDLSHGLDAETLDEVLDQVAERYDGSELQRHLLEQLHRRDNPKTATIKSIRMKPRSEP